MNRVRLILTIVVIFVLANFAGYFIHAIWLHADYVPVAERLYRPVGQEKLLWISLAYLSFAIGSVCVYARGVEDKPWLGQGVRFGILMWLILAVPSFFIAYAVQPVPGILMVKQVLSELIDKIFLGIVTALVYGKNSLSKAA